MTSAKRLLFTDWAKPLRWVNRGPLLSVIEPYRLALLQRFLDERTYNLGLFGRAKKGWKSADLCLAELRAVTEDWPAGSQCYLLANDKEQAGDDLALLKKIIAVNPPLLDRLKVKRHEIERKDGKGFIAVLP